MLSDLYFKTNCNIRPHFLDPMGGLKIEGPLYFFGKSKTRYQNYLVLFCPAKFTGTVKAEGIRKSWKNKTWIMGIQIENRCLVVSWRSSCLYKPRHTGSGDIGILDYDWSKVR